MRRMKMQKRMLSSEVGGRFTTKKTRFLHEHFYKAKQIWNLMTLGTFYFLQKHECDESEIEMQKK